MYDHRIRKRPFSSVQTKTSVFKNLHSAIFYGVFFLLQWYSLQFLLSLFLLYVLFLLYISASSFLKTFFCQNCFPDLLANFCYSLQSLLNLLFLLFFLFLIYIFKNLRFWSQETRNRGGRRAKTSSGRFSYLLAKAVPYLSDQLASKLSGALWRRGGKRSLHFRLWNLNSASNSPVALLRLSCQISANQREAETITNVNKHCKTRGLGNDVIVYVISADQHFVSTFSMQIFKFQRRSCELSFLFPEHPGVACSQALTLQFDALVIELTYRSSNCMAYVFYRSYLLGRPSTVSLQL